MNNVHWVMMGLGQSKRGHDLRNFLSFVGFFFLRRGVWWTTGANIVFVGLYVYERVLKLLSCHTCSHKSQFQRDILAYIQQLSFDWWWLCNFCNLFWCFGQAMVREMLYELGFCSGSRYRNMSNEIDSNFIILTRLSKYWCKKKYKKSAIWHFQYKFINFLIYTFLLVRYLDICLVKAEY